MDFKHLHPFLKQNFKTHRLKNVVGYPLNKICRSFWIKCDS